MVKRKLSKASKKIDAIVALALACCTAIERGRGPGLFVGVDAGNKHDCAAVVEVERRQSHKIWTDIEATIEWRQVYSPGLAEIHNFRDLVETISDFDPRFVCGVSVAAVVVPTTFDDHPFKYNHPVACLTVHQ